MQTPHALPGPIPTLEPSASKPRDTASQIGLNEARAPLLAQQSHRRLNWGAGGEGKQEESSTTAI